MPSGPAEGDRSTCRKSQVRPDAKGGVDMQRSIMELSLVQSSPLVVILLSPWIK